MSSHSYSAFVTEAGLHDQGAALVPWSPSPLATFLCQPPSANANASYSNYSALSTCLKTHVAWVQAQSFANSGDWLHGARHAQAGLNHTQLSAAWWCAVQLARAARCGTNVRTLQKDYNSGTRKSGGEGGHDVLHAGFLNLPVAVLWPQQQPLASAAPAVAQFSAASSVFFPHTTLHPTAPICPRCPAQGRALGPLGPTGDHGLCIA